MPVYRPDIDGLRALAVLLVVFFHLDFAFAGGGFIGVDIFFTISGFLIGSIIIRELEEGHFSFAGFYERRIRRILPAYLAVTLAALVAGFFLLLPGEYANLSASALSTIFYVPNIFFWWESGYFEVAPAEQPLLHTWSLGVEEQFYIVLPLFLYACYRYRKPAFWAVLALTILSFWIADDNLHDPKSFSFFMLPARMGEFGVGVLLSFGKLPAVKGKWPNVLISIAGLACILYAAFTYTKDTDFPGLAALWPCVGVALLIYAGPNVVRSALSIKPLVLIGRASYSLYLWHWPIISFAHKRFGDIPVEGNIAILVLTFAAGFLSWRYIERPWRNRAFLTQGQIFRLAALASGLLALLSLGIYAGKGFPQRFNPDLVILEATKKDFNPLRDLCNDAPFFKHKEELDKCVIGDISQKEIKAFVWGDSVADSFTPGLSELLKSRNLKGLQATKNSCAPVLGAYQAHFSEGEAEECTAYNDRVFAYLAQNPSIEYVFMAGNWGALFKNFAYREGAKLTYEDAQRATIEKLLAAGKKPVLISVLPDFSYPPADCLGRQMLFKDNRRFQCLPLSWREFEERNAEIMRLHKILRRDYKDISVYFPFETLCDGSQCSPQREKAMLYYDSGHLSATGAKFLARHIEMPD